VEARSCPGRRLGYGVVVVIAKGPVGPPGARPCTGNSKCWPVEVDVHGHRQGPLGVGGPMLKRFGRSPAAALIAAPGDATGLGSDIAVVGIDA